MSTILETRGLTHIYGAGTPFERKALNQVSLSIEKGEIVGVIGHTGSGKSTLIQHFNGLLKPDAGEVLLDGQSIWDAKGKCKRETRFRVGLVFQYPEYQLFEETIAKDIAYGPTNMKLSPAEIAVRVKESMQAVGLPAELEQQSPFALSGGQKRRVAIAGVIAMRPDVLILDEPTAGLDPKGRDEILGLVRDYHRTSGATILIVSHSMEDIAGLADRLLVMNHAQVLFCDTPRAVFSHADEIIAAGLDIPQITKVMLELKQRGFALDTAVYTVPQALEALRVCKANRTGQTNPHDRNGQSGQPNPISQPSQMSHPSQLSQMGQISQPSRNRQAKRGDRVC